MTISINIDKLKDLIREASATIKDSVDAIRQSLSTVVECDVDANPDSN